MDKRRRNAPPSVPGPARRQESQGRDSRKGSAAAHLSRHPSREPRAADSLLDRCRHTARQTFGIGRLHPQQESAMLAVLNGRDALVALPTGFGKSLIYQVPAMTL